MTEANRNLLLRVASAVAMGPLVLFLLHLGGWWCAPLLAFAAAACTHEYLTITIGRSGERLAPVAWFATLASAAMPLLPVWRPVEATALVCGATGVVLFAGWTYHLVRGPLNEAPVRSAHILTGFLYGSGGLTAIMAIRNFPDGFAWVFAALVITWGNDTAAYFAGRLFGRRKLYAEVSPGKTWEGFAGGFVGSIGGLLLVRALMFPAMTVVDALALGALGGVLGPAGDLCESMLKRAYGVKDSGWIIPGHGGMLDRLDALIFNAPMVLLYVQFVRAA